MTPSEFAAKIRAKYPGAYDKVDDVTLSKKIVEKYPTYTNQVQFDAQPTQPGQITQTEQLGSPQRDITKEVLPVVKEPMVKAGKEFLANPGVPIVVPMVKAAYKTASELGDRFGAGAGVGLQTGSLRRAFDATAPDFEPKQGEKLGYQGGKMLLNPLDVATGATVGKAVLGPSKGAVNKLYRAADKEIGLAERAPSLNKLKELFGLKKGGVADVVNATLDDPKLSPEKAKRVNEYFKNFMSEQEARATNSAQLEKIRKTPMFTMVMKAKIKADNVLKDISPSFTLAQEEASSRAVRKNLMKKAIKLTSLPYRTLRKAFKGD